MPRVVFFGTEFMDTSITLQKRRLQPATWPIITLILSGCSSLNPTGDIQQSAALTESRLQVDTESVWQQPVNEPSKAWDGVSPLSAETAVMVALQNEPEVRESLANIAARRADLVQAELLPNPTIGFGIGIATDGLSGSPAIVQGLQALTWLWTRPDRMAIAEASLRHSILLAASNTIDLTARVTTAHARVLAAQSLVLLDAENLDITQHTRSLIESRHEAGEAARLDVDRAEVDVQNARTAHIASIRSLEQAKLSLLVDMGWPNHDTEWKATGPVGVNEPVADDDRSLCELASLQRLDLAAASAAIKQELANLSLSGTKRLPEVRFTFGWQRSFADRKAVMPGASLTIPIFDNGDPAIAKASAELETARLQWIDLANHIQFSVRNARSQWRQAVAQSQITETNTLPAATDALRRSQAAYEEGVIDLTVLLLAQQQHIQAQRMLVAEDLIEAESLIELRRAVGGTFERLPDEFASSIHQEGDAS